MYTSIGGILKYFILKEVLDTVYGNEVTCSRSSVAKMLINGGQEQTWIVGNKIITVTTSGCGQRPMRNGLCDKCIQQCRKENSE